MSEATRALLRALFDAAVARADPDAALRRAVRVENGRIRIAGRAVPEGARLVVVAAGKAAASMAASVEELAGDRIAGGLVVTKDGHGRRLARLELREAGHPVPDARGAAAAAEMEARVAGARPEDVLLVLLSGGASALLTAPLPGLDAADLAATTEALLASGADIVELNTVRKHLCRLGGGRLARAAAAERIEVLALSDVLGDDPAVIGSGPCAPDPTCFADALAVLDRRGLRARIPAGVREALEAGAAGVREETPKPGDPALARVRTRILASNQDALEAARVAALELGLEAWVVCGNLHGEARRAGRRLAALARASVARRPTLLLFGGETTVSVCGDGVGGRSQELALAAALTLAGDSRVTLLAVGTDGGDGPTDAAGAFADGGSVARGSARGVDALRALERNDSHGFFAREGGLLVTGPTGTNVMDLVLIHLAENSLAS